MPTEGRDAIPGAVGCMDWCIDKSGADCKGLPYIGYVVPAAVVSGPPMEGTDGTCAPVGLYNGALCILFTAGCCCAIAADVLMLLLELLLMLLLLTTALGLLKLTADPELNDTGALPAGCCITAGACVVVLVTLASARAEALTAFAKIGKYAAAGAGAGAGATVAGPVLGAVLAGATGAAALDAGTGADAAAGRAAVLEAVC
jgi:hypothetical protein